MIPATGTSTSSRTAIGMQGNRWQITRWMLIIRPAIVTATLGVAILLFPSGMIDKTPMWIILIGTYLLTFLYIAAHRITGVNLPLLATEISFDIFLITVIIHYTGNLDSSFVGFYFLSIMCASFFFRRWVTMLFTTMAAAFYAGYVILYLNILSGGLVTDAAAKYEAMLQIVMYSILMFAVGILSSTFSERIFKKDTALISALKLLKEARVDTSDILQSMTNGLLTVSMSGYIVYSNRAAEHILDLEGEPVQGRRYDAVLGERGRELATVIRHELSGSVGIPDHEVTVTSRRERPIPVGLTMVPLYDTDRSRRGIIINFKDLTEKNKLIEMVRQSDRMAAIGELSAAIAHEIRNPLASIGNAAELLKESVQDTGEEHVAKLLHIIEKESERLQRISSDFLKFARIKEPAIATLDLKTVIDEVLLLIANDPRMTDGIVITRTIDEGVRVRFDEDHLKQFLINIIINSLDALDGSGEIVIENQRPERIDDHFIRLVIYDTGPGFPAEAASRMFEPFYSTKQGGTGLGLALVRKLVIANNGRILAQNRDGAGAEIALDIPLNGDA